MDRCGSLVRTRSIIVERRTSSFIICVRVNGPTPGAMSGARVRGPLLPDDPVSVSVTVSEPAPATDELALRPNARREILPDSIAVGDNNTRICRSLCHQRLALPCMAMAMAKLKGPRTRTASRMRSQYFRVHACAYDREALMCTAMKLTPWRPGVVL